MTAIDPPLVAALVLALTVAVVVVAIGSAVMNRRELNARIAAAAGSHAMRQGGTTRRNQPSVWRQAADRLTQRVNLVKANQLDEVRHKLAKAGYRPQETLAFYILAKAVAPLVLAGVSAGWLFAVDGYGLPSLVRVAVALSLGLMGSYLPDVLIKNRETRRYASIRSGLADALDLLVICTESGLSLDEGLSRVSREMALASQELADELHLTVIELRYLPDRRTAMNNLAWRVDMPAIQNLVNALEQAERYGTPVSQALRTLSDELRHERMMRAETKAARLPALMTVPLILFIMPGLFVVLMGGAIVELVQTL